VKSFIGISTAFQERLRLQDIWTEGWTK